MSLATENFVKCVFQFEKQNLDTKPGSISNKLGISNAAITDMAKTLSKKKLVQYEKYQPIKLTKEGRKLALSVIRKHRLWETFLEKTLKLSLHEIHREAELLEHQTSDFLANKISSYLGNPEFDPHGDPIPDENGNIPEIENSLLLTEANEGDYIISRLINSNQSFFDFCELNQIIIGNTIHVSKVFKEAKMIEIKVSDKQLIINFDFAKSINVTNKK